MLPNIFYEEALAYALLTILITGNIICFMIGSILIIIESLKDEVFRRLILGTISFIVFGTISFIVGNFLLGFTYYLIFDLL